MGQRGRGIIERGFSSDIVIGKTLDVYRSLQGNPRLEAI
jgi:hypothetical protein